MVWGRVSKTPLLHKSLLTLFIGALLPLSAQSAEAQLSIEKASVTEANVGASSLDFSVVRSGDTASSIVVPYSISPDTATPDVDYDSKPGFVRIPAGLIQGVIRVPVLGDTTEEPDERLKVKLGKPAAFNPAIEFNSAPAYAAGGRPTAVTSGDFNGDGREDIAVSISIDGNIAVLLADSDGGFAAPALYPAGIDLRGITRADFNGDGKVDLAVANQIQDTVSVLINDGSGHFGAPVAYPVGSRPSWVSSSDLNGDGKSDLVVANILSNSISVLWGNGVGGFSAPLNLSGGFAPYFVTAADLNGDGKLDLLASGSGITALLGDGVGGFSPAVSSIGDARRAALADFNGDGIPDIATSAPDGDRITIRLGSGSGSFVESSQLLFVNSVSSIQAADFDGDGDIDLAASVGGVIALFIGDNTGGFSVGDRYLAGAAVSGMTLANFDSDGNLDIVASDTKSRAVSVLRGNDEGRFSAALDFRVGRGVAAGDFDRDGKQDIAVIRGGNVEIRMGEGQGRFGNPTSFLGGRPENPSPNSIRSVDLDADGKLDLVLTNNVGNYVSILFGKANGTFQKAITYSVGETPIDSATADFNDDGFQDLIVANVDSNFVSILYGNGNRGFDAAVDQRVGSSPLSVVTADFNRDGKMDFAVANTNVDRVSVFLGDGNGGFGTAKRYAMTFPGSIAVSDIENDGNLDLVVGGVDNLAVLFGDGVGNFSAPVSVPVGLAAEAGRYSIGNIAVSDFNGDGNDDIAATLVLVSDDSAVVVAMMSGDGKGGFSPEANIAAGTGFGLIAVADFDGNGSPDITVSGGALLLNSPQFTASLLKTTAVGTIVDNDEAPDSSPDDFSFESKTGVALKKWIVARNQTLTGFNSPAAISVSGGEYRLSTNGVWSEWTSASGVMQPVQKVQVRVRAATTPETTTQTTLTVGGVSGNFSVTTAP
ncbi:hypothetical protein WQQ_29990 [Hydrocarboniphaga effusa AP103]|uniref:Calx-beta domain-containing protein n=2 Tax=Nevskiaceae TaxID=568386 RepID=I7ZCK9_9GAMM|nr:hypothetical protein WQQ_29990 [Hydrocarboniphaga effusa AP103]